MPGARGTLFLELIQTCTQHALFVPLVGLVLNWYINIHNESSAQLILMQVSVQKRLLHVPAAVTAVVPQVCQGVITRASFWFCDVVLLITLREDQVSSANTQVDQPRTIGRSSEGVVDKSDQIRVNIVIVCVKADLVFQVQTTRAPVLNIQRRTFSTATTATTPNAPVDATQAKIDKVLHLSLFFFSIHLSHHYRPLKPPQLYCT